MTDSLPVLKTNQELALDNPASDSLFGRELAAIQLRQNAIFDQEALPASEGIAFFSANLKVLRTYQAKNS